jgi:cytidylate kinase
MNKVITISREYGAGGHTIGKRVAQELGIELYDKDIFRETVKASGFAPELVEKKEEDVTVSDSILNGILSSSVYYPDTQDTIHDIQRSIILRFARSGPCILLGRCADEILRHTDLETLNVFIHADVLHRAARISKLTGITNPTELKKLLNKRDASRRSFYAHYTGKKWGDCHNYDMMLDSGTLGDELCVQFILEAARADG